ncbi:hypothetical protein [Lachnotalea sp. AF33-28]|uniref:hypothetical protein n=1 Tax=Lachnotalea sp. AF33-28 TaxID=2292046 RepID=UPI000E4A75D7|nr:hypothetical protein [Lachnotalea sp. AF33-28]RHP32070.1 hypothetical protein DWZ56_15035 [Lachnotalea sp. AF33-28]
MDDGDGNLVPVHMTDEYMEAVDWFKKLYDDGLLAKDWAIRDGGTWKDDSYNGKAGAYMDCLDDVKKIWDYYVDNEIPSVLNDEEPASMAMVSGISKDGQNPKTAACVSKNFFVITRAAQSEAEVQACLEFLDKLCGNDALMLMNYGLEGINWEKNSEGEVEKINVDDTVISKSYAGLDQLNPYIPNKQSTDYTFAEDERTKVQNEKFEEGARIAVYNPALGYLGNAPTYVAQGGNLNLILSDARTQYIVGQIDREQLMEQFDLWYASGGEAVIAEVNEQYHADRKQ